MPFLRKHALAVLSLLSLTSSVDAGLIQGPTGVEYVKRFQPSAGPSCFFQCPAAIGSFVVLNPQGTEVQNGVRTQCEYVLPGQASVQLTCSYNSVTGIKANGGGNACPATATQTCPTKKRRKLSKLEEQVKKRQWKGPKTGRK